MSRILLPVAVVRHVTLLGLALSLAGCQGMLLDETPLRPGGERDPIGEMPLDCSDAPLFEQPLRVLSPREYEATLTDLVGPVELRAPGLRAASPGALDGDQSRLSIDADLMEAYLDDAETVAVAAMSGENAARFDACALEATVDAECARSFLERFGRRVLRRPLDDAERGEVMATFEATAAVDGGHEGLVDASMQLLVSASFLYRVELGVGETEVRPLTSYEVASRLSFLLHGRAPSEALLDAAAAGELGDRDGRAGWAERLLYDEAGDVRPEARQQVRGFVADWLGIGRVDDVVGLPADVPEDLRERFRAETEAFIDEVVFERGGGIDMLLDGGFAMLDAELAAHYGVDGVESDALTPVEHDVRRGLLQQGTFLAPTWAGDFTSAHRGAWVIRQLSCEDLGDPPPAASTTPLPRGEGTARDRLALTTEEAGCAYCHDRMNPIGFALENFDEVGRWRELDYGNPIDATVQASWLSDAPIEGPAGLGAALAESEQVRRCASAWVFRYVRGRGVQLGGEQEADLCAVERLRESGDGILDQLRSFVASDAFAEVRPPRATEE